MSSLADRLRGVLGSGPAKAGPYKDDDEGRLDDGRGGRLQPARGDAIAEMLDGEWQGEGRLRYLVVDRRYGPGHRHGHAAIADAMPPDSGVWPRLNLLNARGTAGWAGGRVLFIDLETTGLAGGAGTYAFLVGCAWFDGPVFRVRQFLLSSFGAEAALLCGVAALADGAAGVVTYNGKSFDMPLLETRFVMNRMDAPLAGLPHVDMLHPSRRLWKETYGGPDGGSCRLSSLERTQFGFTREGDVGGFEIPSRYFAFVRTGDARPLERVLEHNRLDLISLALLTGRACQLMDEGFAGAATAREALGLGRMYEAADQVDDAQGCYARAGGLPLAGEELQPLRGDATTRGEALRAYAILCRRSRQYADAAMAWSRLLDVRGCPSVLVREASEALAVHHEHRLRDAASAREFALRSLRFESSRSRQERLNYRLARLNRKLGAAAAPPATPLFSA